MSRAAERGRGPRSLSGRSPRSPRLRQPAIREALLDRGEFHLSSTEIAGRRYLRVVLMSPATDEPTLVRLLDTIEGLA